MAEINEISGLEEINDADYDDLEAMFGQDNSEIAKMEKIVLSQNLEGFASCFPDWDLHPPVNVR